MFDPVTGKPIEEARISPAVPTVAVPATTTVVAPAAKPVVSPNVNHIAISQPGTNPVPSQPKKYALKLRGSALMFAINTGKTIEVVEVS